MQPDSPRTPSWTWAGLPALALLAALGFFGVFALPYLLLDAEHLAGFAGRHGWVIAHVFWGGVALFVGPFQLWMGGTGRYMPLHRRLGRVYLASIVLSCVAAFYLAFTTLNGWMFGLGLGGLACAWTVTTALAWLAIRRRNFVQHREWMIRSYVVTLGFVFFRAIVGLVLVVEIGTPLEAVTAASWVCWAFPLLITEACIQGRKVLAPRQAA